MKKEATSHDQLFKDLLRAFFREFIELFFPDVAARLDFSTSCFSTKKCFPTYPKEASAWRTWSRRCRRWTASASWC
jgi:hypothetical protein